MKQWPATTPGVSRHPPFGGRRGYGRLNDMEPPIVSEYVPNRAYYARVRILLWLSAITAAIWLYDLGWAIPSLWR